MDLSKLMVTSRCSDFEVMPKSRAEPLVVSSQNCESFVCKKHWVVIYIYIVKDVTM